MAERLALVFETVCNRLDSRAKAFWDTKHRKQLRLKFEEVQDLLNQDRHPSGFDEKSPLVASRFAELEEIAYGVDELIDDWEQSEKSKGKIEQQVRSILAQLERVLESFHKRIAGEDEEITQISEVGFPALGDFVDLELLNFNTILSLLLRNDEKNLRFIAFVGIDGAEKSTLLAQRIYDDERVKSYFQSRAWVSVGENLEFDKIVEAIAHEFDKFRSSENKLPHNRFLLVLDDVSEEDDMRLEKVKSRLEMWLKVEGSCVLVTTRFRHVADVMGTVQAQLVPLLRPGLGEGMGLISSKSVGMVSTSGCKDESTSAISGHFEVQSERVQGADTTSLVPEAVVVASTSESKDQSSSAVLGHFEIQSDRVQGAGTSQAQEAVAMASSTGSKDEPTSAVSGHFQVQDERVKASDTTSLSSRHQVPAPSSEIVEEDAVPLPPQIGAQPAHESEIQIVSSEAEEKMLSIYTTEEREMKRGWKASGGIRNQSVLYAKKSIKRTVRKIFSHINNVRTTKIAVIGAGGIGKTTVLKALVNFVNTKHMFDEVILLTVSRYWSTRKVQDEVLRQFSLCREYSETDSQVAERLLKVLKGKKFLLLLDDVWEQVDLGAVGIPDPRSENGCKIVIASRKLDTFHEMNLFKVVEVKGISWKEARELFYEQVGTSIPPSDIKSFAETIVKSCGGLPLLIIVTGRALGEKNDDSIWKDASERFSLHKTSRECQIEEVLRLLKFSFDQLSDNDVKSCFLHCALFPEAEEVNIHKFIEYCIREGLITGAQADAHRRGRYIIDVLVHASLLQVTEGGDSIKMHDLIRDLALGILSSMPKDGQFLLSAYSRSTELRNAGSSSSSRSLNILESSRLFIPEGNQFLLRTGAGLTEPPLTEEFERAKMMFLSDNEFCTLPEKPNCPELLTLFLQRNRLLRVIPPSFFDFMTSLKVLNLSGTRIRSLPETIFELKNLEIFILRDCECLFMLPSEVGSLVCLEVLDLRGTKISELPDKIGELTSLRHLGVSFYGSIDDDEYVKLPPHLISIGIISKLGNLDTLSIALYPGDERWYEDVKYVKTEVCKLKKLNSLCFHFPEIEQVHEFLTKSEPWKNKLLTEFNFVVGVDVKNISSQVPDYLEFDYNQQGRCLRFVYGENIPNEVLQILARSTAFYLDNHFDIESLSNFGSSNINGLRFCIMNKCPNVKTAVHVEEEDDAVFPLLETLSIHHLWNLTCIWEGILPKGSFAQLRILSLYGCPKLKYVFRSSMMQYVCKLEEVVIEDCPAIEHITLEDEISDSVSLEFPSLKKLALHYLPGLVNIRTSPWPQLERISFYCCPNLKKIGIDSKDVIIRAEKSWWDALEWENDEWRLHLENCCTIIFQDHL